MEAPFPEGIGASPATGDRRWVRVSDGGQGDGSGSSSTPRRGTEGG